MVKVPVAQPFVVITQTYVEENNHYKQIENVDRETQTRYTITENNNKIIADERFFFQSGSTFQAGDKSKYTIKFFNTGRPKLISLQVKFITE